MRFSTCDFFLRWSYPNMLTSACDFRVESEKSFMFGKQTVPNSVWCMFTYRVIPDNIPLFHCSPERMDSSELCCANGTCSRKLQLASAKFAGHSSVWYESSDCGARSVFWAGNYRSVHLKANGNPMHSLWRNEKMAMSLVPNLALNGHCNAPSPMLLLLVSFCA